MFFDLLFGSLRKGRGLFGKMKITNKRVIVKGYCVIIFNKK
jgi:hypothetical protein